MSETTLWLICSGFNVLCLIVNAWMVSSVKRLSENAIDAVVNLLKEINKDRK